MDTTRMRVAGDSDPTAKKKFGPGVPLKRLLVRVLDMGVVSSIQKSPNSDVTARPPDAPSRRIALPSEPDFDAFYRANYPTVTRLAYSLCGSLTVAEELAQEAFVAAHDRWCRIATFDRPDLWVRRVVINRSISFRRKEASERRALRRVPIRPLEGSEPVLADEDVWRALRELSARQAEVLALVYVEDRPIAEVAAILRLGEETVRTHLKRGRAALAVKLGDREEAS